MLSNHLILWCPLLLLPSIFPASGSFLVSQLFTPSGQSIGASASASVFLMNIQGCFPLGLSALTSLMSKGLLGLSIVFSSTTIWKHQFFSAQSSLWSNSHWLTPINDYWEDHSFCYMAFIRKVMSLLLDKLSRLVIDFLTRYKCLLLLWLRSPSAVILKPPPKKKENLSLLLLFPLMFAMKWWGQMPWLVSFMLSFKLAFSFSSFSLIKRL